MGGTTGDAGRGGFGGAAAGDRAPRPGEIEAAAMATATTATTATATAAAPPTTTTLLYSAVHSDASVLACRAPALGDWLLRAPAAEQLAYLHGMHVEIDGLLRRIRATKVSMTGKIFSKCFLFCLGGGGVFFP